MIDHSNQDRRATDNTQEDIRSLILDMPDQKDKALRANRLQDFIANQPGYSQ